MKRLDVIVSCGPRNTPSLQTNSIVVRVAKVHASTYWEFTGWYPEYWEFTKANYNPFPGAGLGDYLRFALPCYDAELAAELVLWERMSEPGTRIFRTATGSAMNTQARAPLQPG